jgi:hypothetical protein
MLDIWFANMFSQSVGSLHTVCWLLSKDFNLLLLHALWCQIQKSLFRTMLHNFPLSFLQIVLEFKSLTQFYLVYLYGMRWTPISVFCMWICNFPSTIYLKRISFFHCVLLVLLSKNQVTAYMHLWDLCSVPLINISSFYGNSMLFLLLYFCTIVNQ